MALNAEQKEAIMEALVYLRGEMMDNPTTENMAEYNGARRVYFAVYGLTCSLRNLEAVDKLVDARRVKEGE